MKDPDKGAEEIMSVISTDPSIVAGVLKTGKLESLRSTESCDGSQ